MSCFLQPTSTESTASTTSMSITSAVMDFPSPPRKMCIGSECRQDSDCIGSKLCRVKNSDISCMPCPPFHGVFQPYCDKSNFFSECRVDLHPNPPHPPHPPNPPTILNPPTIPNTP